MDAVDRRLRVRRRKNDRFDDCDRFALLARSRGADETIRTVYNIEDGIDGTI